MRRTPYRIAAAACLALAVAACSLPHRRPTPVSAPKAVAVVPAPTPLPLPVQTERFILKPGQQTIGQVQIVRVAKHETLSDIARRFNVGYDAIVRANPKVDPWLPPVGTPVIVPTEFILPDAPHRGIVVNVAALRLFYFPPHKRGAPRVVITHPVGIGRIGWHTPVGATRVMWHEKNPVWHVPVSIRIEHRKEGAPLPPVVGPGPDNPLGKFALHLGWPGYLIHGTNKPVGVGRRVSHGCIHLYPEDIAQIFHMVPNGTEVRVVNQPYEFGWKRGRLYMQSYGPLKDDRRPWKRRARLLSGLLARHDRRLLRQHHERIDWQRVRALMRAPRGVPMPVSGHGEVEEAMVATLVQNRLPEGSTWNGKTDLPLTNAEFHKMFPGKATPAKGAVPASASGASPPAQTTAGDSGTGADSASAEGPAGKPTH